MTENLYYGAHLSISKGIKKAVEEITQYDGNFIQVFVSNPRSGRWKDKKEKDIQEINNTLNQYNVKMVIHSPYVLNFSKPFDLNKNDDTNNWWLTTLINEVNMAAKIDNCIGTVLHFGKSLKISKKEAYQNYVDAVKHVVDNTSSKAKVIIETAAGQGTEICYQLEEFKELWDMFALKYKKRLGLCIDTCHIFAAGYDIRDKESVQRFFKKFKKLIGIEYVSVIHLNDSKKELGSRVDRHAKIGEGMIGRKGIKYVVKYCRKKKIPIILETPDEGYKTEIRFLKKWLKII
tara:strand:+ start:235 stop:1104 length:870 start_codon:yes stop_codon:yes gene_type:complete